MPKIFGIPLIGVIQMVLGAVIVLFILIKYKKQPKRKHNGEYVIQDVHILTGDGTESEHKNVYIKKGADPGPFLLIRWPFRVHR